MIDELLGRAALKERIQELEEERDRLERRLDAESERRREAVRDRQEADERVNRLEDRVADLEGRLERVDNGEPDLEFRGVETLRGARLREVLDRLASLATDEEGALTAMIDDSSLPDPIAKAFGDHAALCARAAPCLAVIDDSGLVSAALVPPVEPEPFATWSDRFEFDRGWFLPSGRFAFALVRSDTFALGEYDGRDRRSIVTVESDVKAKHSKGGFSQGRFERRRDAQIDDHLDRCREVIEDRESDRLIVVGERTVLGEFEDDADATALVDATGDPERALDDAFQQFWTTRLYCI